MIRLLIALASTKARLLMIMGLVSTLAVASTILHDTARDTQNTADCAYQHVRSQQFSTSAKDVSRQIANCAREPK